MNSMCEEVERIRGCGLRKARERHIKGKVGWCGGVWREILVKGDRRKKRTKKCIIKPVIMKGKLGIRYAYPFEQGKNALFPADHAFAIVLQITYSPLWVY